jgi:hypothetical protein
MYGGIFSGFVAESSTGYSDVTTYLFHATKAYQGRIPRMLKTPTISWNGKYMEHPKQVPVVIAKNINDIFL